MAVIRTLLLKKIGTEKTEMILSKIVSVILYIAGFLVFIIGFIKMRDMNILPEDLSSRVNNLFLWMIVLVFSGAIFELVSELIKIKREIKMLKDKIGE